MGTFSVACEIANIADRSRTVMLVATGSELTSVPRSELEQIGVGLEKEHLTFQMANGEQITRSVGFAILLVEDRFTVDEVVFAEEGDLHLLGERTLEGLNLTVDPARKKLVAAGPMPAA